MATMIMATPLLAPLPLSLIGDVGGAELLVVLAATLVLFGGKGLPGIARTLGRITRDVQKATQEFKDQLLNADQPPDPPVPPSPPKEEPPRAP